MNDADNFTKITAALRLDIGTCAERAAVGRVLGTPQCSAGNCLVLSCLLPPLTCGAMKVISLFQVSVCLSLNLTVKWIVTQTNPVFQHPGNELALGTQICLSIWIPLFPPTTEIFVYPVEAVAPTSLTLDLFSSPKMRMRIMYFCSSLLLVQTNVFHERC